MNGSRNLATNLVSPQAEDHKLELVMSDEGDSVSLRYATWTDRLGWCVQKTMLLSGSELDHLHHAVAAARHRLNRKRAECGEELPQSNVVQMPTLR